MAGMLPLAPFPPTSVPPILVVGAPMPHLHSLVRLLHRSGAACDFLTTNPRLRPTGPVRRTLRRGVDVDEDWMVAALRWREGHGGRIMLGDDGLLSAVRDSALSPEDQARLLGVIGPGHLDHVGSKAGLAEACTRGGVPQPRYRVASGACELTEVCEAVGYPAVVKLDRSGGGDGVFVCRSAADTDALADRLPSGRLLIQEWVDGETIDLSGFFGAGRPVHFVHAEFLETVGGPHAPSKRRRYTHPGALGPEVFEAVATLAGAIGLDGVANVTAMRRRDDGALLFIEADLRPNVWVEMSRHMGDDPAPSLRAWFERGETMARPRPPSGPATLEIAYLFRLAAREAWLNRHGAWRQFADHDPWRVVRFLAGGRINGCVRAIARRLRRHDRPA